MVRHYRFVKEDKSESSIEPTSQSLVTNLTPGTTPTSETNIQNPDTEIDSKYKTESDFLNHPDGVKFQAAAYRAAKAFLNGDLDELSEYLSDSFVVSEKLDLFKDIDYMILKWGLNDMISEDNISASYEFRLKGEDSVSYVTMKLIKDGVEWKVDFIGLEK